MYGVDATILRRTITAATYPTVLVYSTVDAEICPPTETDINRPPIEFACECDLSIQAAWLVLSHEPNRVSADHYEIYRKLNHQCT